MTRPRTGYLRRLMAPEKSRWKPMLAGLAIALAGVEAAVLLRPGEVVSALIAVIVFAAWAVGACAMVGFVRWFFASELEQVKLDKAKADEKVR